MDQLLITIVVDQVFINYDYMVQVLINYVNGASSCQLYEWFKSSLIMYIYGPSQSCNKGG